MRLNPTIKTAICLNGQDVAVTLTHCSASPAKWGVVLMDGGVRPLYPTDDGKALEDRKVGIRIPNPDL